MSREHAPRPGVTWERELLGGEQLVPDDAEPQRPNRATRRAMAHQIAKEERVKLNHKVNFGHGPKGEPISESYQREIEASQRRAEKAWRKAQQAAERAERIAAKRPGPQTIAHRDEARRLVLERLDELKQIEELMQRATHRPATVAHRTGREERLELGVPVRRKAKQQPTHAVTVRRKP